MHPNETTLNEYADGTLGEAERAVVDQHLAACASCRDAVEDLREILRASRDLDQQEPPVRAWPRLERALKMEREGLISVVLLPTPRGLVIAQPRAGRS